MEPVALIQHQGDIRKSLEQGLNFIDGLHGLKSPVIIKPNICTGEEKSGFANTNVKVVEALITLVLEKDSTVSIKIVESDSGAKFADDAFRTFGYTDLEERMKRLGFDVSLVNLSRSPTAPVQLDGLYFKDPELPTIITEPSFFVSLAVAKTHGLAFITGTLKNLFGLLPRKDQFVYHPHINEIIVDLNRVVRSDLCIVDARVGIEGWAGPRKRHLDAFIVGKNTVSVDSTMARVMGFDPCMIRQLLVAEKVGLGSLHPKVLGVSVESIRVQFNPPTP